MARKKLKWQVTEALQDSALPPPARLLMFVFSDLADATTGTIPEERKDGVSIGELARRTGLSTATVKRHKADLVRLGWLVYTGPTGPQQSLHETGDYTIAIGRDPDPVAQSEPPAGAHSEPPPQAHSEPPQDGPNDHPGAHSEPVGGSQRATPQAHSEPPIKEADTDVTDTSFGPTADAAAPKKATKRTRKPGTTEPAPRPDVEALCTRLAELMVANGCKTPPITQAWRDEARRMLDLDGRDFDKAMRLLEWSQSNPFWRSNIQSMPTFRKQYDQLRLKALAEWERARGAVPDRPTTGQQRLAEAQRIADEMRALDQAEAAARQAAIQSPIMFALPPGRTA